MFHTRHSLKRSALGVAITASLVALTAPAAFGGLQPRFSDASSPTQQTTAARSGEHDPWWYRYALSPTRQQARVPFITDTLAPGGHTAPTQGYRFITDTLGGNGHPKQTSAQGYRFITDTLGGNGHPKQTSAQGYRFITDTLGGNGGPSAVPVSGVSGFQWGDAGIGAASSTAALLVLLGCSLILLRRRGVFAH